MKLYHFDDKHAHIIGTKDFGDLSPEQIDLVNSILDSFSDWGLLDGWYRDAILAKDYVRETDEDGHTHLHFIEPQ